MQLIVTQVLHQDLVKQFGGCQCGTMTVGEFRNKTSNVYSRWNLFTIDEKCSTCQKIASCITISFPPECKEEEGAEEEEEEGEGEEEEGEEGEGEGEGEDG
jgi:hypothetical protein